MKLTEKVEIEDLFIRGHRAKRSYLSYSKAKRLMSRLKIKNEAMFNGISNTERLRYDLPFNVDYYIGNNRDFSDFFYTEDKERFKQARDVTSYEEAKEFLKKFRFRNMREYKQLNDIFFKKYKLSKYPWFHYSEYVSDDDYLGITRLTLEDFIIFLKINGLNKRKDYMEFISKAHEKREHIGLPKDPRRFYKAFPGWREI